MKITLIKQLEIALANLRQAEEANKPYMGDNSRDAIRVYDDLVDYGNALKKVATTIAESNLDGILGYDSTGDRDDGSARDAMRINSN